MITVYQETDYNVPTYKGMGDLWYCVVADHPEVNATHISEALVHGLILESWNRNFPDDPKTAEDFEYVTPPEGWVNPCR
ncbi:hypothetical protein ACFYOT_26355 [Saccharothrix saharensis]|uniref:hypothetical protein n=1 Tax=Saccharothrix saharensis TaxID=571190 RepID=UPI003683BF8B